MTSSAELRSAFLNFFRGHGHEIVASSPLIPGDDPTLLFTNAGMVQFKDVFLGTDHRPYSRATTAQRCVRAGGKHNDLENVGYTARHHTFFEMLGNFSFGDYFKRDAITFAWEFLTGVLRLPADKLWVTVYATDDEAYALWADMIGVPKARIVRIGDKPGGGSDNFWQMGDTGPCGPCTEIFYDHGPEVAGGPPGSPDEDGDRYIEIWNLVFMQFNRDEAGVLHPLPKPSVDTGMGLERLAAVMQHVHSNYEIDLFANLIRAAMAATGATDAQSASLKVIADHIRSTAFLITDGVVPSNEGRGYVLRRIMRRAIRHGYKLGAQTGFFHKLVPALVAEMGAAYPELATAQETVTRVIAHEEERFAETLEHGMKVLEADIAALSGSVISGTTVFRLYDTYGFPVDLTADIARERGLTLDMTGYEAAMEGQRAQSRAHSQFGHYHSEALAVGGSTAFCGYTALDGDATVTALFRDGQAVARLEAGQDGIVVLDATPFYAESGGQVGDSGRLSADGALFAVSDCRKQGEGVHLHIGRVEAGALAVGARVHAAVDAARRSATALNHSATHLLHAALRQVLGTHVMQKGSLVDPERLRFDFSHPEALTPAQIETIERLVNAQIRGNVEVTTRLMPIDTAKAAGALALFGEKYGDEVRVLSMGAFSTELCGGTHVGRVGDIGLFKITAEGGVAAGIRRIEAVTGERAYEHVHTLEQRLQAIAHIVRGDAASAETKVRGLAERVRGLEKELEQAKARLASSQGGDLAAQAVDIDGLKVLAARLDGADARTLRDTVDQLKNKLHAAAVVLAAVEDGKVRLVAGVTDSHTTRVKAGDLVNQVAQRVGGKGGGRADLAQAGGTDPSGLDAALAAVPAWVASQLG
ncbi:alanyl-tRNA synthetase [Plasticicumulans lactativorans]|uniref:Alanine--tRNA ligase n=1 Tax=Plasticicumulans lactativorans TaxID=1133106 RepID=A0A4R2KWY0_9GAMM|nr:alanine--tRNA ligase [Plasticicumulans lactativorans]TCO75766.1 alanyl-tRNA synthetase [Plasticicumulans lactativorans]